MSESLIALDPGKNAIAGAHFVRGQLQWVKEYDVAKCCSVHWLRDHLPGASAVAVWEKPQHDGRNVPLEDVIPLAAYGGILAGRLGGRVESVEPREWKGSVPKAQNHRRAWAALTAEELSLFTNPDAIEQAIYNACERGAKARWKKSSTYYYRATDLKKALYEVCHNRLDAIALGLWYLGRGAR